MVSQLNCLGHSMLIVEDDADARDSLRSTLHRKYPGLTLHVAEDGRRGLELFREVKPEIVLTDIRMPRMNGLDMAQEIRRLSPETQIIVVTAHNDTEMLQESIKIGVSRYLLKPITSLFLFEAVEDCLNRIELVARLKAQHEELIESGERLRLALESTHLGTWDLHPESGEVLWDQRCRDMFGLRMGERIPYAEALALVHPEDRSAVDQGLRDGAVAGGNFQQQFRVVWPDGSVHWIAANGRYSVDDDGVGRFIGATLDITDRKRTERDLVESESRYRGLFVSLQEGFSLLEAVVGTDGMDYRFLEVNPAFEHLSGLHRERLLGRTLSQVFPHLEPDWLECLGQVALTGQPATLEHHAGGSDRFFEVLLYSPAQGQVAALYSDVSERRKLQMEREKNERLESLGVLAGGIAHDFNNILMAIAGNISLARTLLEGNGEVDARLEDSEKAVSKAAGLTRQLLTFARGGEPVKRSLNTASLIREAASLFLSGTNCKAELELPPDLWSLHADGAQINQALNNLIVNAIQSMPKGGVISIKAANEVAGPGRGLSPGRYLKIVIEDQGSGIAPELLPRIFDPYFTTKSTGSGLGLASVFSIVKRHDGSIQASSIPGAGARFELLLPASSEASAEEPAPAPHPSAKEGQGRAVLVMDDELMIRNLASLMLGKLGYRAVTCPDGAEAVRLYQGALEQGDPFAAVILDMTVPGGMGGKEAAQLIRSLDREAVLVISSGYSADPLLDERGDVVVNGVVSKPYNIRQLAEELAKVIPQG